VSRFVAVPESYRLEVHDCLSSTNDEAVLRARGGDSGRLWIIAREQTAGRGRHGRDWQSLRGNLFASLLLLDPAPERIAPKLGFAAAVALAQAASDLLRHDSRLALKWPNDLLFGRAKLAGILLEGAHLPGGVFACVLGFGVNCSSHPSGLPYPSTDLSVVGGPIDAMTAFERLAARFAEQFDIWDAGRGFARIRETWLSFADGIGERVTVRTAAGTREGVFEGLDDDGRLLLGTNDGLATIEAGDVFLATNLPGAEHRVFVR
jgi:BirA family transcriptional regulator, biotin operon repressor / biotin---[acetyl-CoA-carboxylase] ligase